MIEYDTIHLFIHIDEDGTRTRLLDARIDDGEMSLDVAVARAANRVAPRRIDQKRHGDVVAAARAAFDRQESKPGSPVYADADLPWGGRIRVGRMVA